MTSENNKRIAKNTLMLYIRMLLTMAVSLYTSRIVLKTLGIEDYGIYNVVGGLVLMFSSINLTMATAVQRFMNFEMGRNNAKGLNNVFNISVIIHLGIAFTILLLLETVGVWFLNFKMKIPLERVEAANWALQFSIFSFLASILSVPYNAAIIANERMSAFAVISIIEVTLKLLIVFILTYFNFDKLKFYAILMFVVTVILRFIYSIYAKKHFKECHFQWIWDKSLFKEMVSFAGWNTIGVSSTLIRTQGINIVMNLFFGTIVNAAMGITNQVKNAVESFTNNFVTAINPQITKSYAAGEWNYLNELVFQGSRYAFYLLLLITLPVFLETKFILHIWLGTVPAYTEIFIKLILVVSIIESLSKTLIQTMFATGKIKTYQIIVGSITILNLPLSILLFYAGYPSYFAMIVNICIAVLSLFIRLTMLKMMVNLSIQKFIKNVLFNVLSVAFIAFLIPFLLHLHFESGGLRFISVTIVSVISVLLVIYFVGLSKREKVFLGEKINNFFNKI